MKGKKMLLLVGALMLTTVLTGCRVGSGNNNTSWDENERNEAAKKTVIELEFNLSIKDAGLFNTPDKDTNKLMSELESDELYQLAIRSSQKYNYDMIIDMDPIGEGQYGASNPKLGMDEDERQRDMTITKSATVSGLVGIGCYFEVYENANGITNGYKETDAGKMTFELKYLGTEYKVSRMIITFNGSETVYTPRSMTSNAMSESACGFGLGQVVDMLR